MEKNQNQRHRDNNKRYVKRMKDKGFKSVTVWVPAGAVKEVREYLKGIRKEFIAKRNKD